MQHFIAHHGIKGQKWGVRRFQNKDGTLTSSGKKRYSDSDSDTSKERIVDWRDIKTRYTSTGGGGGEFVYDEEQIKDDIMSLEEALDDAKTDEEREMIMRAITVLEAIQERASKMVRSVRGSVEALSHSQHTDWVISHAGIPKMRWGRRRYQNPDGTWTEEGKARRRSQWAAISGKLGLSKEARAKRKAKRESNKKEQRQIEKERTAYKRLSDEDLAARNKRLKAEAEYKSNFDKLYPKKESLAKKFLSNISKNLVEELPKRLVNKGLDALMGTADDNKKNKNQNGNNQGQNDGGKKKKGNAQNQTQNQNEMWFNEQTYTSGDWLDWEV